MVYNFHGLLISLTYLNMYCNFIKICPFVTAGMSSAATLICHNVSRVTFVTSRRQDIKLRFFRRRNHHDRLIAFLLSKVLSFKRPRKELKRMTVGERVEHYL
jgi:hypothetical protein